LLIRPDSEALPRFKRSDLANTAFYLAHEQEILAAQRDNCIEDDVTPNKPVWGKPFGKSEASA
jgi:hypothetical protein